MKGKWVIIDNHIAIDIDGEYKHPMASEVYDYISEVSNVDIIKQCFPNIRFSKIGSELHLKFSNVDSSPHIQLTLYTIRNGEIIFVDIEGNTIIDHCIWSDEWFYISGDVEELSEIFKEIGIYNSGIISLSQYTSLLMKLNRQIDCCVENEVDIEKLNVNIDTNSGLPDGLNAKLYNYQKTGYFWMKYMLTETGGCILGDEMGLGKTLQVITVMLDNVNKKNVPLLVVAPVSLLQNWYRECEKFAPSINVLIHHGSQRTGNYKNLLEYDVVVVSYNTVVSDLSMLKMVDWKLVVLDEAQNIKNPNSNRTGCVKKLPRKTCIAMSGTPFENHMTDIWSLVDFVKKDYLGTLSQFNHFVSDDIDGAADVEPLLTSIMIRRLVANVAKDLPEKVIIPVPLAMSEEEANEYENYRIEASSGVKDVVNLGALQRLRMFCTHPRLCGASYNSNVYNESIKYQRFCEIMEEIIRSKEKVILFTSYRNMFDIFRSDIPERFEIPVWTLNGDTKAELRQEIVDQFNEYDGSALLVLNPRAAGTGLNITAANHVIHYNLEWNPALEDQASARAYRRGQKNTVFIYRLYYEGTVEQIVNERIERKREISDVVVVGTDGSKENREDIIAALSISPIERGMHNDE